LDDIPLEVDASDRNAVGVIARVGLILRILGEAPAGLSLGQIAKRVSLARSTVQRLVNGLEMEGLVETGPKAGQITLGLEFLRLAQVSRPRLLDKLHPLMVDLSAETGETTDLSVIRRARHLFVDQVIGTERLLAVSHVGDSFPLYCSSVGKAYLATLSRDAIQKLIGTTYQGRTEHTRITLDALEVDLAATRRTGIGVDLEEHSLGIASVGITFEDRPGDWYGLSVPVPVQRFKSKRALVSRRLLEIRSQIVSGEATGQARVSSGRVRQLEG
jgi:DNA-binding IclR family transcriptional regulator